MQTKIIERYFFFGLLSATLIFTFFIFSPFWIVLILGASFAVILYPVYEWIKKGKLPDWLSAILTVLFFIVIVCGPLFGIAIMVFDQSQNLYHLITDNGNTGPFLNSINNLIQKIMPTGVSFDVNQKASEFISFISGNIASVFSYTVSTFLSFVLVLLSIFYFLKDGSHWKKALIILSPLSDDDDEKIINKLSHSVNGVIKGTLLIALIQGILMGVGLTIFGVPNPALWGLVTMFTALVPTIGTSLVSIPAIIFLFITGDITNAIGFLVWSLILVGTIDNLLNPIVLGHRIELPPILILFSVLGGISLLGPVGILIGPLSVSLLYTLISIYRKEFKQSISL